MDERLRFVSHLLDGEAMSEACREFGRSAGQSVQLAIARRPRVEPLLS